ncbi:uncharacterized protein LOC143275066 [Babylonia areolata]|uniref:uncharacterized protein LOC143275066 n=1 Tax=Babylonia areolata TaxID=304850 RepID=UPI003FD46266
MAGRKLHKDSSDVEKEMRGGGGDGVEGTCRFPEFLQRKPPWAASYGHDARLVMYVEGTFMSVSEQTEHRDNKYTRKCERRAPDNKFLVTHQEDGAVDPLYLCIQFLQRSENIVQMKVSEMSERESLELCDERMMAIDRWPIVQMSQTPEQKIPCPFLGGYNVNMFYPNDTAVCQDSTLLMRIESECERGEGIVFDFRQEECVPVSLPARTKQQAYCIAHWTQAGQTFIILQHSEIHEQTWCLRISDPLSDIHSAHLMLDLVCDTGDVIRDTKNYFRLTLSRRVYDSTCEDEIESDVCQDMKHLCQSLFRRHCARTCGSCGVMSEMRDCAFEETYRGLWMDSGQGEDKQMIVDPYSITMEKLGRYDCLTLEGSERHKERMVLARFDETGCYPRYTCVEMEKVSSSVMRFRLGNRHQWPLQQSNNMKDQVCSADNFVSRDAVESRFHVPRPARLLVKEKSFHRVSCGLPRRLQNGIAFREEGQSCSGCLMYQPSVAQDRFVVRPHNCSFDGQHSAASSRPRLTTIDYSCLAAFTFFNNTYAVVTKTVASNLFGQYLCWIFTPDNHIKVIKAAETFLFEEEELLKPDLVEAQFSIIRKDAHNRCRNVITMAPSPTHSQPYHTPLPRLPDWVTTRPPRPHHPTLPRYNPGGRGRGSPSTYGPEVAVTHQPLEGGASKGENPAPPTHSVGESLSGDDTSGASSVWARTRPCCSCCCLWCAVLVLHVLIVGLRVLPVSSGAAGGGSSGGGHRHR